ncbi:RNI-like protein, partial [Dioscorea alata]
MKRRRQQQHKSRSRKKAKTGRGNQNDAERFSHLPDELCISILSKLTALDAVRTSILSKRWKDLWMSATSLKFDYRQFPNSMDKNSKFIELICQWDTTFCLQLWDFKEEIPNIRRWISFTLRRFVQELELFIHRNTLNRLPDELFTRESLTVLSLTMLDNVLELPSSITLPNVRTPHLGLMAFQSCPKLEYLGMSSCSMYGMEILNICSSELQNLSLSNCRHFSSCETNISAPKLQSFRHHCHIGHIFSLENLCTIRKVEIGVFDVAPATTCDEEEANRRTVKILHGLENVRTLTLSSGCTE